MIRIGGHELQQLLDSALSFQGKHVVIVESISRSRDVGKHDRHFATRSQFAFKVENVLTSFSGAQLSFNGENACYGISLDSVVSFRTEEECRLEIVEHFEQQTERRTQITSN